MSFGSEMKLICSLVISIFLYEYELWTLIAELENTGLWDEMLPKVTENLKLKTMSVMTDPSSHCTRYTYTFFSYATCEWPEIFIQNKVLFCSENMINSWFWSKNRNWWFDHIARSSCLARPFLHGMHSKRNKNCQKTIKLKLWSLTLTSTSLIWTILIKWNEIYCSVQINSIIMIQLYEITHCVSPNRYWGKLVRTAG